MKMYRVTFVGGARVERLRAESFRDAAPWVEFVVAEGNGLDLTYRVVARFDGREIERITTVG
jgi:hypothetical protein